MTEQFIWTPKVLEKFEMPNGPVFTVESDRTMNRDKPECVGWTALLGDRLWDVIGCERFLPATPIQPGEIIGLLVKPHETKQERFMKTTLGTWHEHGNELLYVLGGRRVQGIVTPTGDGYYLWGWINPLVGLLGNYSYRGQTPTLLKAKRSIEHIHERRNEIMHGKPKPKPVTA